MGQVTYAQIAYQGFEATAPTNAWTFTSSAPSTGGRFNTGSDIWEEVSTLSGITPSVGNQFWGARDVQCPSNNNQSSATLTFADVVVTNFTGVTVKFDYRVQGYDGPDDITYNVVLDGVQQPQVTLFGTGSTPGNTYVTETINIPSGTNTVGFILRVTQNGADEAAFDNFILDGTGTGGGCSQTVLSFTPSSAPVGAKIRVRGTGFTSGTTVDFNGTAATSVVFVSPTELLVTVPNGATTGAMNVIDNSCTVNGGTFNLIAGGGSGCGIGLVISEVYDERSGSLGFIELYNGTGGTVDLTNYQINRFGTLTGTVSTTFGFPTSGVGSSIAPGQVLVGRISNDLGGGTEDFTFTPSSGINDNDRLELVLSATGVVVDDWHEDIVRARGYVYRRNTNITGANPTYTASEWTTATTGDRSDLGSYNITAGGALPSITVEPLDQNNCSIDLSVTATSSNGGTLTYQWFYHPNDGVATSWSPVTAANFLPAVVVGATTNNLRITGDLTNFNGYQFYVQVEESGTCQNISEAAQFNLTTGRFFRSAQSGNWTDPSIWETASSAAGPWSPTCTYPVFDNSDYIHVLGTHTVTVNADLTVDEMVIEPNGTVVILSNRALSINNGPNEDLLIKGTLIDNGNGSGNGLRFLAVAATWEYGSAGEVVKTGSSSVVQYRDHYDGGISNVTSTAIWRYRFTGNSSAIAVATVGMFYPNLYFESTNGDYSFNSPTEVFRGASNFMTVKGSFFVGTTGTGRVEVFNTNTNATAMQILGDMNIGNPTVGRTSKFENNRNGITGTGIEVFGNIFISSDGELDFSDGTNGTPDGIIRLHGNWTDNQAGDGFREGESTVFFIGNTLQLLNRPTAAGNENFYNVVVNKSAGFLDNNIANWYIENDMNFIQGIVRTTAAAYLVFEASATASNASNNSFVDGPVIRETDNGTPNTFIYPTGNNSIYGPIGLETRFHLGQDFVARYHNTGFSNYTVNSTELDHVSSIEYWELDKINGNANENLRVTLSWGPHSQVITPNSIRVAHFFQQAPSAINQWEREGNSPVLTGTPVNGTVKSDWVTTFSPFTLGDVTRQRSLPLNLLSFEAERVNRMAHLEWAVANEQAGDRYCLQRSSNGVAYETLVCLEATEAKQLANYQHTDEQPLNGYNYYRIQHIDHADNVDYSPTKVLDFGADAVTIQAFPNPTTGPLNLVLPLVEGTYQVEIVDVLGRVVDQISPNGQQRNQSIDLSRLTAGTYLLRILHPSGTQHLEKITLVH